MNGMFDVTCPKCSKRHGWQGTPRDRPPCPRCGHKVDPDQVEAVAVQMDEDERLMLLHPKDAKPRELAQQRKMAGLSRGQVQVMMAGLKPGDVANWEEGVTKPTPEQFEFLSKMYHCGDQ